MRLYCILFYQWLAGENFTGQRYEGYNVVLFQEIFVEEKNKLE